eukprot:scaffold22316_cov71-Phaeocystis_antarctica.AAC.2
MQDRDAERRGAPESGPGVRLTGVLWSSWGDGWGATLASLVILRGLDSAITHEAALAAPPNRVRSDRPPHGTSGCTVARGHSTDSCRMAARRCGAPQ